MAKKFFSALASKLTRKNWKEHINLKTMNIDEMIALRYDMSELEKLGKEVSGYLRTAIKARMNGLEYETDEFEVTVREQEKAGGLDIDRIREDYGDEWIEKYRKEGSSFFTMSIKPKES